MFRGLAALDWFMIVLYFGGIVAFGLWMSRRVKTEVDYFLGGRKFGKAVLVFHWLCTGTHTDNPVQVSGACYRVGLGGIWYQWMWLFCTPFYWLIAPITRRLRYITTGDFFRDRYSAGLERLYSVVGIVFYVMTIAGVLLGAGRAISGATGGAIHLWHAVIVLSVISGIYVLTGGLVAAAYTDLIQGFLIIVLSVMLIPFGLEAAGGWAALREKLPETMFRVVAPAGAKEGSLFFVAMMSLACLVGIVVQPHTLTATGSGKTELEARMGMCYGNFIKRFLTIAWALTGLIAVALIMPKLDAAHSDEVWGRSIRMLLPTGFRGLMLAAMLAGVTACETYMVVGSSIFTRNFYEHFMPARSDKHYLFVGRVAAGAMLLGGIFVAFALPSLTEILKLSIELIAFMGAAFWVGICWRRANAWGAWAGTLGAFAVWVVTYRWLGWDTPARIAAFIPVEFGLLILVSWLTSPHPPERLDKFYAMLHTSVAVERQSEVGLDPDRPKLINHPDFEIPRLTAMDIGGFVLAWAIVAGLIFLLRWIGGLGA